MTIVSSTELVKGRALLVRAEIEGFDFSFNNIYAPNQGSDRSSFFYGFEGTVGPAQPRLHNNGWGLELHASVYTGQN